MNNMENKNTPAGPGESRSIMPSVLSTNQLAILTQIRREYDLLYETTLPSLFGQHGSVLVEADPLPVELRDPGAQPIPARVYREFKYQCLDFARLHVRRVTRHSGQSETAVVRTHPVINKVAGKVANNGVLRYLAGRIIVAESIVQADRKRFRVLWDELTVVQPFEFHRLPPELRMHVYKFVMLNNKKRISMYWSYG
jgi:hypothetical protein